MALKSKESLGQGSLRRWQIMRRFVPERFRFFFEGHPSLSGQLWYAERQLIYETVRMYRPENCCEIGTWRGGGSTLFTARALYENGRGKLHTIEIDQTYFNEAVANYRNYLPELTPFVDFHLGDYRLIYPAILVAAGSVDFLILDGPEDAGETLAQYNFFLPYLRKGSFLMIHDWFTEKSRLVKPILEEGKSWTITRLLVPPHSPGLALAVRK